MTQVDGNVTVQGDLKLQYQSDIYTPPPVVYLRMNEGSGTTAADSSNAGNNLNGTLGGNASWTSTKYKNGPYAVEFDGNADYIDLGTSTTLKPNTAMSISAWVYSEDFGSDFKYIIAAWPGQGAESNYSFFLGHGGSGEGNGKIGWGVMKHPAGGTGVWLQTDDVVITLNQWHHVAVTYSGANNRMRIYIDGALKDATHLRNAVPSQISQGSHNVAIGYNYNGSPSYPYSWDGAIDELSMWDVELTADQVSYLYGNGVPPNVSVGIP